MNRTLVALSTSVLLLVSGLTEAQDLFGTVNVSAKVTFFNGDPRSGSVELTTVTMNNSPVATTLAGVEQVTHVTVSFQGVLYTFALAERGWNKETILLTIPESGDGTLELGQDGRVSLAELFNTLATDQTLLARLSSQTLTGQ